MHSFGLIFNLFLFVCLLFFGFEIAKISTCCNIAEFLVFVTSNKCDLLELKQTPPVSSV